MAAIAPELSNGTARLGGRDALVIASMTLVALAIGAGLHLQFGVMIPVAALTALLAALALSSSHVAARRSAALAALLFEPKRPPAREARTMRHQPSLAQVAPPTANPQPAVAGAEPAPDADQPSSTLSLDSGPPPAAKEALASSHREPMPIDAAARVDRLHGLIKELADTVGGPRATTPDPDAPAAAAADHAEAVDPRIGRAAAALGEAAALMRGRAAPALAPDDPRLARLAEAINAERVAVYLEPIQGLGDRRPHHFEVSVRLHDASGAEIATDDMRMLGRGGGLMPRIDSIKLPRVLRVARRVRDSGRPADILSALAAESLSDNGFIDRFAAEFNAGERIRIVFAFSEADVRAFGRVHWQTLEAMADMGIRFALEDVTALDLDLERLRRVGFEFVKLDAAVFSSGLPTAGAVIPASDLCSHLSSIGLTVVVARIEDEWALARVMGFGAVYGQGTLFGGPRPVRADVLAEASAA